MYEEAIQAYCNAIISDPNNSSRSSRAWNLNGLAFRKLGDLNESIKCLDEATRIDPNNTAAWCNKGDILNRLGKYDEAIAAYDRAIELDPEDLETRNKKGDILKLLGRVT